MNTMRKRSADILMEAADLLNERGWTRGIMEDKYGRCCLLGAIEQSLIKQKNKTSYNSCSLLKLVINEEYISRWNDTKCKSRDHAISVLHEAASLALYEEE